MYRDYDRSCSYNACGVFRKDLRTEQLRATTSASGRRLGDSTTTHRPRQQRPLRVTTQKRKNIVTTPGHPPTLPRSDARRRIYLRLKAEQRGERATCAAYTLVSRRLNGLSPPVE